MELLDWFQKGLSLQEYLGGMKVNKDEMMGIYDRFSLSDKEKARLEEFKDTGLKVIVLTEDWCGDAMLNNPILLKIAEESGMEVRFILRDENLELMDQYLTNGTSRAIPIYIFIDKEGKEKAVWGPRAKQVQEMVDEGRSKLPAQYAEDFKDKQMSMYRRLTASYQEDSKIWHFVADSIADAIVSGK
ncbi:thiol-disulfide isomerase/thioredoxin [Cytobacillus firmus]|uniref:Thiol-disulfide isomerase/thioredoxin n=2 Tax=Cytobacillus TaxID=2675230 RepID=A0A366JLS1_CYTFI|nr:MULTISPECIES: thioredoxin family protein [Cytobacillus]RBP88467.1 thiol-disulfide isomerase/thioredoxin [Cytobacillus firmus]TDX38541.1 thiol-disulfide isomerase/thioredoxin [Cytobacillus oceanisediminis]